MITPEALRAGTVDELKDTQSRIVDELKYRVTMKQMDMKRTLKPGDKMKTKGLSPQKHNGKTVTIISVKNTRASVQFENEQAPCTIPLQCMEAI